jgi:drug/metabolite transporter (DMT)-like permease
MGDERIRAATGRTEWGLLLLLAGLWGGSFFFAKIALAELPPLTLVLARVAIAAAALHLVVIASGGRLPRDGSIWRAFFVMGALNNLVPFSLICWGQTQIASALASILNATTPLFTLIVAHVMTADERMTRRKLVGVVTGFIGVAAMIGGEAIGAATGSVLGQAACLGAALSYAFAGVYGRRFRAMALTPAATATGQLTATTLMMAPLASLVDQPWGLAPPSLATWGAVLAFALLCTSLGYVLYFRILATSGATNLLLVTFLMPVGAILLGTSVLGERLAAGHLVGMALIGLGLAVIDGRPQVALGTLLRRSKPRPVRVG